MSSTAEDNNGGGGEIISSKKECTSCEQNNVDNITERVEKVAILGNTSKCACCGKEGNNDNMNTCNKCKMVKYCNAACKKKHRTKHKKECKKRVAELHDEQLFKDIEPNEECPICMLPLPHENKTSTFNTCCGKEICIGCIYAMEMSEGKDICAFCRTPPAISDEEEMERLKNLMDKGNAVAFSTLGGCYADGDLGLPQDDQKANKLYLKAGELGCAAGYYNLGNSYHRGRGVERDVKKAQPYWQLAAMGGIVRARQNLGCVEGQAGNIQRAFKHMIIGARAGSKESLDAVKIGFMQGIVTKDGYASTLRTYHERQKEMKSDARDKAAASDMFSD